MMRTTASFDQPEANQPAIGLRQEDQEPFQHEADLGPATAVGSTRGTAGSPQPQSPPEHTAQPSSAGSPAQARP